MALIVGRHRAGSGIFGEQCQALIEVILLRIGLQSLPLRCAIAGGTTLTGRGKSLFGARNFPQRLQFYMFAMVETRLAASEDGASPVSTRLHKIAFSAACKAATQFALDPKGRVTEKETPRGSPTGNAEAA